MSSSGEVRSECTRLTWCWVLAVFMSSGRLSSCFRHNYITPFRSPHCENCIFHRTVCQKIVLRMPQPNLRGRSTGAEGRRRERGAGIAWFRISLPLRHARALLLWSFSDQLGVGLDDASQSTCSLTSIRFVQRSPEMHAAESLDLPVIQSPSQSRSTTPSHNGPPQIGFLGLGTMGHYMARNLATHPQSRPPGALPLLVFNRTADKARSFQSTLGAENVRIADSVGQLAVECDVIITNLATDEVVLQIYRDFAVALSASRYV